MDIVIGRSSDTEIDWNIFRAPSLAFGGFAGGSLFSVGKAREKLEYTHNNTVRRGLVANAVEW